MNRKAFIVEILKQIRDKQSITLKELGVDLQFLAEVSELILDEGLAKNIHVTRGGQGNKALHVSLSSATVTMKGLDYIEANVLQPSKNDLEPKIQIYAVPWPVDKTDTEVEENPPAMPQVDKFLEDSKHEILGVETAKVRHFTQYWYAVTIQYQNKIS